MSEHTLEVGMYGAWFYSGGFYIDVKETDGEFSAHALLSKNVKVVHSIDGKFDDLESLLASEDGKRAKEIIEKGEFDFLMIGHGKTATYYLNHDNGLIECEARYIEEN